MGINSILTVQLENIHVPIPLNRTRSQSVPTAPSKRSRKERKRRPHRHIFVPDKPPFVNYASAYINPYNYLAPIINNPDRPHRFKSRKRSKRKQRTDNSSINTEVTSFSSQIISNTDPIDLWPSDPNGFDMDFIRKRQIAIDNTFYRETIDTWKPSSFNHLIKLIKELTKEKNIIDRVWIIYYWISQNILYDIDTNINIHNFEQKADDIFRSGKTTSEGYAALFQRLCDEIHIKCFQISGYTKDSDFHINQSTFSHLNHTWNAVQLDNSHWYLIDSVWGSGYMNANHQYKKTLQTYYFLTRPEYLIYTHLPKDSHWQLLAKPISLSEYFHLPYLHSYYFIYNLTIISPRFSSIIIFDRNQSLAEILIQAPNDIQLTCSIKDDNQSTSLTQYDANRQLWQCLFAPYQNGFYTLVIYANRLSISNVLTNVIELGVEVSSKNLIRKKILPITFGKFLEYKCQIISPLDGILKSGRKVTIHCRIPNASYGRISVDGIWLEEIEIKDNIFKQEIIVPEQEIIIYAQFLNKKYLNMYNGLIRYLVEK